MNALYSTLLFLLFAVPAFAQTVVVVRPDGSVRRYAPLKPRIIHVHDTLTVFEEKHDTVKYFFRDSIVHYIDTGWVSLTVLVEQQQAERITSTSNVGVYGFADFRSATIAPSLAFRLLAMQMYLYVGAYYTSLDHITRLTAGISAFVPLLK